MSYDSLVHCLIKVITKLPNSEQSYKGKVKTHNYINIFKYLNDSNGHWLSCIELILYVWHLYVTKFSILCIKSNKGLGAIQQRCSPSYRWWVTLNLHVENTCMNPSFQIRSHKTGSNPPSFLKCLYQARKMSGQSLYTCVLWYQFCSVSIISW
jgi:hypothetical protein